MRLIGLTGAKRSGKDTLAEMLVAEHGYVKYSLATPIKEMLLALDPFMDGPTSLARFVDSLDGDWDRALADRIHGAELTHLVNAFTEKSLRNAFPEDEFQEESIREMLFQLDPRIGGTVTLTDLALSLDDLEALKGDRRYGAEIRQLMQRLGTDVMRDLYGENVWIDHLSRRIAHQNVVVADVRFENEAQWINTREGSLYKIQREGLAKSFGSAHVSEAGFSDQYITAVIENNGVNLENFRHLAFETILTPKGA